MDLTRYDLILINSSGGKDSQVMLSVLVEMAIAQGVLDRLVVVHADLGRVEWEGTKALAREQAEFYNIPFEAIARAQGDLLSHIEDHGMFPGPATRYCTSDHKRGQIQTIITALHRKSGKKVFKVLNCMGIRAQESSARSKKQAFQAKTRGTTQKRTVDTWYPIFDWTVDQVWTKIKETGVPHHYAYDLGMPRLSCIFCVFAPKAALMLAGKHNRALLEEYVRVEEKIGHDFRNGFKIADVKAALDRGEEVAGADEMQKACSDWNM